MSETTQVSSSIKAVTLYEVVKGVSSLIAAYALWNWRSDITSLIELANSVWMSHYGSLFSIQIDSVIRAAHKAASHLQLFLFGIIAYAVFRFIEAYGLWHDKTWAYWFGLLGYGLFIPAEIYYLIVKPFDFFKLFILLLNILVVFVVFKQMRHKGLL